MIDRIRRFDVHRREGESMNAVTADTCLDNILMNVVLR